MMAKSKIVKMNGRIADYLEDQFTNIEDHVIGTYTKIEDTFVDRYLTQEGESVEEAKERLKDEKKKHGKL